MLLQKLLIFKTPLRYLIVITSGFLVDFSLYMILVIMGNSIYLANSVGFCIGTVINVLLIRKFVFPDSRFKLIMDLPLTFATNGAMLGVGMGLLWLLVDALLINPYGAKLMTNGSTFILNYVIRAAFFRKK